jgi:alpha-L-rhamnosidase
MINIIFNKSKFWRLFLSGIILLNICLVSQSFAGTTAQVTGLKCEYLSNPIGIDARHPRLTWVLVDESTGAKQTAYQLWVTTDSTALTKAAANMWQTTKVPGSASLITYQGKALQPFTKYYWKVAVWDNGKQITSPIASFEIGMMNKRNWKGTWISDNKDIHENAAPYFRHIFKTKKKIVSAKVYIAAAGLFELYFNGEKVGNHRLDPMYTRFDRRTLYVSYDVTPQIKNGANAVGVLLGNGWYNHQSTAVWYFHNAPWRGRPTFCLDLRLTYSDGSTKVIKSDTTWRTSLSPITFNSIYTAEHYDARLEQPGWNTPIFDTTAKHWAKVITRSAPSINIVSQAMQPIRAVETIPALSMTKLGDNLYLYNLGRNISGVSRITVKGAAGTIIRLKHAERLNKEAHADQSNIDYHYRPTDDKDPFQTDIFILSGKGEETFMPRFNYKGFQYVEVSSDKPVEFKKESLTGYFMHSDVEAVGQINSSSNTLNKIWYATNNSYLSNLFGYPTDCPQREKNGWTGDAHIASETGFYGFDGITIYEKWMGDHRDEQQPNGVLPAIIPTSGWVMTGLMVPTGQAP